MITSISWNNVWRNKTRSLVVVVAITLGTVAGVFVAGLMNGWVEQRVNAAIYTEVGHLKIQNPQFLINEEAQFSIKNYKNVISYLENSNEIEAYSMRSKIMAMATTARGSAGIMLKGIDIGKDKKVSDVYSKLVPNSGSFFEGNSKLPKVFISNKTAEQLRIKNFRITQKTIDSLKVLNVSETVILKLKPFIDKRFITKKKFETALENVLTVAEVKNHGYALSQAAAYFQPRSRITFSFTKTNGEIGYQTYQVCGVFKTSNTMFDQMSAFVKHEDLYPATGLGESQYHEISIITTGGLSEIDDFKMLIDEKFADQNIMTWKELSPDAGMMADFMQIFYYIVMGIIFFALAFGIINTMLMAILERTKELGMLMAIGMKKFQVFRMIMLETIFLTLTGSVLGMVIGALLIKITSNTGLNFSSVAEGFEAIGFAAKVYPNIELSFFFGVTIMVVFIAIISSIIPARKALSLKPVEALRTE